MDKNLLFQLFPQGKKLVLTKKSVISTPHQRVTSVYWLLKGTIEHFVALDKPKKNIMVGKTTEPMSFIGWNGLNDPMRFSHACVIGSKEATLFEVSIEDLNAFLTSKNDTAFMKSLCQRLYAQFGLSLAKAVKFESSAPSEPSDYEGYYISPNAEKMEIIHLMRRSPFLEKFDEEELLLFSEMAEQREYEPNEVIYSQGHSSSGLFILIEGEVNIQCDQNGTLIKHRSLSTPGFIFGWSSLFDDLDHCSAITSHKTSVYYIDDDKLKALFDEQKELGTVFYRRLVWLIGNQINTSYMRYVNSTINHDQLTVHNLVQSNKSKVGLYSPIHQVPHLLNNQVTKPMAYEVLHRLNTEGDALERHISSVCLEFLKRDEKELRFMEGLGNIYQAVVNSEIEDPEKVRFECAKATKDLFAALKVTTIGEENLPEESGHIFIYNHLLNDPFYTLNNGFQITLDSHFISSLIVNDTYGAPGIRTVRVGDGMEYGHQDYYERLGYINVYLRGQNEEEAPPRQHSFYEDASKHLSKGENIIISPEGTSYISEESPGPFKMGAFNLAFQNPNSKIVPIVLYNFDKRINGNNYYCKILPPLSIKEQVDDIEDLKGFVRNYELEYAKEVDVLRQFILKENGNR